MSDLVESMKSAALAAVDASKPCAVMFGTVISAAPLKISVEQKLTLEAAQLILTRNVTEHKIEMTVEHFTEDSLAINITHNHSYSGTTDDYSGDTEVSGDVPHKHPYSHAHSYSGKTDDGNDVDLTHKHDYKGRKVFMVHHGLVVGEQVLLIRMQGGQKFIVVDRVVKA